METGAVKLLDAALYRRGVLVTALARWLSLGLAVLCFAFVWNLPETRPLPAAAVLAGYLAVQVVAAVRGGGYTTPRWARVALDAVDALAVGLGAAFSGGLRSPIWLLLYPHAVAVSVRRGLLYAMSFSALDAAIVTLLAWRSDQPLGALHALAILFCGFMGGTTSSYRWWGRPRTPCAGRTSSSWRLATTATSWRAATPPGREEGRSRAASSAACSAATARPCWPACGRGRWSSRAAAR
jgi:hypothetical protein